MEVSEVEVDQLGHRLRSLYARRRALNKPNYRPSRKFDLDDWRAVARMVLVNNADPIDWIDAAFEFNTLPNGPFEIVLKGPKMLATYNQYRVKNAAGEPKGVIKNYVDDAFRRLRRMLELNRRLPESEQKTDEEVILDPWNRIRPFVAVVAIPDSEKIREKFLKSAKSFVRTSPVILDAIYENGFSTTVLTEEDQTGGQYEG